MWYLNELLGTTTARSDWIYLSDGGHFENLGVYELVRRRVGLVICVDAGANPRRTFGDLGNAVRKCRIDFGVDIKLDTEPLRTDPADGRSPEAYAFGDISYPAVPGKEGFTGRLLYIKPSIPRGWKELPPDIVSYRARHGEFPHEATVDQWFTESQFESYRQLGYLIGSRALKDV